MSELGTILVGLREPGAARVVALEQLRALYERANTQTPTGEPAVETILSSLSTTQLTKLFESISRCLSDNASQVDHTLVILADDLAKAASGVDVTAPDHKYNPFSPPAVPIKVSIAVPGLLSALAVNTGTGAAAAAAGDTESALKRAALGALLTLFRYHGPSDVLALIIKSGFLHEDRRVRQESVSAICSLLSSDVLPVLDPAKLMDSLMARLRDSTDTVVAATIQTIRTVWQLVDSGANTTSATAAASSATADPVAVAAAAAASLTFQQQRTAILTVLSNVSSTQFSLLNQYTPELAIAVKAYVQATNAAGGKRSVPPTPGPAPGTASSTNSARTAAAAAVSNTLLWSSAAPPPPATATASGRPTTQSAAAAAVAPPAAVTATLPAPTPIAAPLSNPTPSHSSSSARPPTTSSVSASADFGSSAAAAAAPAAAPIRAPASNPPPSAGKRTHASSNTASATSTTAATSTSTANNSSISSSAAAATTAAPTAAVSAPPKAAPNSQPHASASTGSGGNTPVPSSTTPTASGSASVASTASGAATASASKSAKYQASSTDKKQPFSFADAVLTPASGADVEFGIIPKAVFLVLNRYGTPVTDESMDGGMDDASTPIATGAALQSVRRLIERSDSSSYAPTHLASILKLLSRFVLLSADTSGEATGRMSYRPQTGGSVSGLQVPPSPSHSGTEVAGTGPGVVVLGALQCFEALFEHERVMKHLKLHLPLFFSGLVERCGDGKTAIGTAAERALCKLLRQLTPASIVPLLLTGVAHENWRVRKQSVQSLTYTVLVHSTYNFDLISIVRTLGAVLDDPRQRVRTAALESLAVVHAYLVSKHQKSSGGGNSSAAAANGVATTQLFAMLSMLQAPQLNAVQKRIAANVLPTATEYSLVASNYYGDSTAAPLSNEDMKNGEKSGAVPPVIMRPPSGAIGRRGTTEVTGQAQVQPPGTGPRRSSLSRRAGAQPSPSAELLPASPIVTSSLSTFGSQKKSRDRLAAHASPATTALSSPALMVGGSGANRSESTDADFPSFAGGGAASDATPAGLFRPIGGDTGSAAAAAGFAPPNGDDDPTLSPLHSISNRNSAKSNPKSNQSVTRNLNFSSDSADATSPPNAVLPPPSNDKIKLWLPSTAAAPAAAAAGNNSKPPSMSSMPDDDDASFDGNSISAGIAAAQAGGSVDPLGEADDYRPDFENGDGDGGESAANQHSMLAPAITGLSSPPVMTASTSPAAAAHHHHSSSAVESGRFGAPPAASSGSGSGESALGRRKNGFGSRPASIDFGARLMQQSQAGGAGTVQSPEAIAAALAAAGPRPDSAFVASKLVALKLRSRGGPRSAQPTKSPNNNSDNGLDGDDGNGGGGGGPNPNSLSAGGPQYDRVSSAPVAAAAAHRRHPSSAVLSSGSSSGNATNSTHHSPSPSSNNSGRQSPAAAAANPFKPRHQMQRDSGGAVGGAAGGDRYVAQYQEEAAAAAAAAGGYSGGGDRSKSTTPTNEDSSPSPTNNEPYGHHHQQPSMSQQQYSTGASPYGSPHSSPHASAMGALVKSKSGDSKPIPEGSSSATGRNRSSAAKFHVNHDASTGRVAAGAAEAVSTPSSKPGTFKKAASVPYSMAPATPTDRVKSMPPKHPALSAAGADPPAATTPNARRTNRSESMDGPPPGTAAGNGTPSNATDAATYTATEDLKECSSPDSVMKSCEKDIKSPDWKPKFAALDNIRRLAVYHSEVLIPHLKDVIQPIRALVLDSRSSLAKNALLCLSDMFERLGKNMDSEAHWVIAALMKRAAEGSAFLADEAIRAMTTLIQRISEAKSMNLLLTFCSEGGRAHQTVAALFLEREIETIASRSVSSLTGSKDFPKLVAAVGTFVGGATADMRTYARRAAYRLCQALGGVANWDNALKKIAGLSPAQYAALKKLSEKGGLDDLPELPIATGVRAAGAPPGSANPNSTPAHRRRESKLRPTPLHKDNGMGNYGDDGSGLSPYPNEPYSGNSVASGYAGAYASGTKDYSGDVMTPVATATPTAIGSRRAETAKGNKIGAARVGTASGAARTPTAGGGGGGNEKQPTAINSEKLEKSSYPELEQLTPLWTEIGAADWSSRMTALGKLSTWIETYPAAANVRCVKIFEQLTLRVTDSNRKVNAEALNVLSRVIHVFRESLPRVVTLLMPPLTTNLASNQPAVRSITVTIVDDIINSLDRSECLKSFSNIVAFGAPKAKPIILDKIVELIAGMSAAGAGSVTASAIQPVTRFVVPLAFSLLDNSKNSELERGNQRLLSALAKLIGTNALFDPALTTKLTPQTLQKAKLLAASNAS